jgi:hypothetical protein
LPEDNNITVDEQGTDNSSDLKSIRDLVLANIKNYEDGIKLRSFASNLGVTWQKLLPVLKELVKENLIQLKDSDYFPVGVNVDTHIEHEGDNNLPERFMTYLKNQKEGITLRDSGSNMNITWQKLLPIAKDLIDRNMIVKEGNKYFAVENYNSKAVNEKPVEKTSDSSKTTREPVYMKREEAKIQYMSSQNTTPNPNEFQKKKNRVGTVEGTALILAVVAFGCFWGWTLPSIDTINKDQITLSETVQQMNKDIISVRMLIEQAKTEQDIRDLKEIQIILDNVISRKSGDINKQAFKIRQDIENLIKMLNAKNPAQAVE